MWGMVGGFLLKNLHIIAIVAVVGFLLWRWNDMQTTITRQQTEIAAANGRVQAAELATASLQAAFDTYRENQQRVNEALAANSTVRVQQQRVRGSIRDVPVTTQDTPFSDAGLLERARRMREYQTTSPAREPTPSGPAPHSP